eukprot:119038-Pyramimonas_sp.AAC.1
MASVELNLSNYKNTTDKRLDDMGDQIKELQRLVGVLRSEEPVPPPIVDRSVFDRTPDGAILVARTRTAVPKENFRTALRPIIERNNISMDECTFEGAEMATRQNIRLRGN